MSNRFRRPGRVKIKVVLILLACMILLGAGVVGGHYYRKQAMASAALQKGQDAFAKEEWATASKELRLYLSKYPNDKPVLEQYAEACMAVRPRTAKSVSSALGAYRRILSRFSPGDPEISLMLAKLYAKLRDYGEMAYICEQWVQVHPGDLTAQLWMCKAWLGQNKIDQAEEALGKTVAAHPNADPEYYRLLSAIELQKNQHNAWDRGLVWMTKCVEQHPKSARPLVLRAHLYTTREDKSAEDHAKARADLEKAATLTAETPYVWLLLADEWTMLDAYEQAEETLERVESIMEGSSHDLDDLGLEDLRLALMRSRATLALQEGDRAIAGAVADRALRELEPAYRDRFLDEAVKLYIAANRLDDARAQLMAYREVLNKPGSRGDTGEDVALLEARLAAAQGRPYEVVDFLKTFLVRGPSDSGVYSIAAWAYRQLGDVERARALWEQYLERVPTDARVRLQIAETYAGEDWQAVLRHAEAAQRIAPSPEGELLATEARIMLASTRPPDQTVLENCVKSLTAFSKKWPAYSKPYVLRASACMTLGRMPEAVSALRDGLPKAADPMPLRLALTELFTVRGDLDQAIAAGREAVAAAPAEAAPYIRLASLLARRGDHDEAQQVLKDAIGDLEPAPREKVEDALVQRYLVAGKREEGIALLESLRAQRPGSIDVRARLLTLPELRQDQAAADSLLAEMRAIEDELPASRQRDVPQWKSEQALLKLESPDWRDHAEDIRQVLTDCVSSKAIDIDRTYVRAVIGLGQLYTMEGKLNQAEQVFRVAYARQPDSLRIVDGLLRMLERQGKFVEAEKILSSTPNAAGRFEKHRLGLALHRGEFDSAAAELRQRVAADPADVNSRILLALLMFREEGDREGALELLDEAAKIDPDEIEVTRVRAFLLVQGGQRDQAEALLNAEVKRRQDFPVYWLRARFYQDRGQLAKAEADYRRLTQFEKSRSAGFALLGQFYAERGRMADAVEAWTSGVEASPKNVDLRRALAQLLLADDDPDRRERGRQLLASLLNEADEQPAAKRLLPALRRLQATDLMVHGDTEEDAAKAETLLREVIQENPQDALAWRDLAKIAYARGAVGEAKRIVSDGLAANENNVDLQVMMASLELDMGSPRVAQSLLRSVAKRNPDHQESRLLLARLYLNSGDINAAAEVANELTRIAPTSATVQMLRSQVMLAMGKPGDAIENLRSYIDQEGGDREVDAILLLAKFYIRQNKLKDAEARIAQAEALTPDEPDVIVERLRWLAAKGDIEAVYQRAMSFEGSPEDCDIVLPAAAYLLVDGTHADRLTQAREVFGRLVQLAPESVEGYLGCARGDLSLGRIAAAIQHYRRVLQLKPYHAEALNDLSWLLADAGDPASLKEALELANRGVERYPDHAHLRDTRGVIYWKTGKLLEARADLEKCRQMVAEDSRTYAKATLHLAQVMAAGDEPAAALPLAREAAGLDQSGGFYSDEERAMIESMMAQGSTAEANP